METPEDGKLSQIGTQIMADASDDALIDAIADGDRHALEVLYSRHSAGVYRFAMRFVADEGIAEDVMNEVFFDVWRKARSFEGRSQVSTWLLGVARNKALEITRRRRRELLNDEACEAIEDAADDPDRAIQRKQNGSILFECLKNLSPVHRRSSISSTTMGSRSTRLPRPSASRAIP